MFGRKRKEAPRVEDHRTEAVLGRMEDITTRMESVVNLLERRLRADEDRDEEK